MGVAPGSALALAGADRLTVRNAGGGEPLRVRLSSADVVVRPDGRIMRRCHLERARAYFDRRGPATVVMARFLPVIRTFTPITSPALARCAIARNAPP